MPGCKPLIYSLLGANARMARHATCAVNDAERLRNDPAMMRWIVGGKATSGNAASASQMGRFETRWLTAHTNLSVLADLAGHWIDRVHARRPPRGVVLDMIRNAAAKVAPLPNGRVRGCKDASLSADEGG